MKKTLDKSVVKKATDFIKFLESLSLCYVQYEDMISDDIGYQMFVNFNKSFRKEIVSFKQFIKRKQEKYVNKSGRANGINSTNR